MSEPYGFGPGFGQKGPGGPGGPAGPPSDMPAYGAGAGGSTRRYAMPETHLDDRPPGFGAPTGGAHVDSEAFGRPPLAWLGAAAAVALAALVLAVLFGSGIVVAAVAWLAAGPVAIGLLAVYAHRDTLQRARAVYDDLPQARIGYWAVALVALAGILVSAWQIAQWAGRL